MHRTMKPPGFGERIHTLDVLRGFSLFGIILVNMISFHSPFSYYNPYEWFKYDDLTVYTWIDILVQGSFYPIFAMMFGYGMVIMQERSAIKSVSFWKISIRRLIVLLFFGIIHAYFIWYGDILITYAIMGLLLLLFLRLSGPILLGLGFAIYLLPQIFLSALLLLASLFDDGTLADFTDVVSLQLSAEVYATGTFWEITVQRFTDWSTNNGFGAIFLFILIILPLMMIGAGAAKLHWLQRANKQKRKWLITLLIAVPIGLAIKMLPFYTMPTISIQYVQDMIGGPILGIGYIAFIILIMNSKIVAKLLKPIASAGRMSITLYLMQSLIGTLIFYSYGLGLYGQVSMSAATWLAVAIYITQVILAEMWLSKFRQGPVEKLWRLLTYGKATK
ncbi:DUF418 domain-containing protein [Lederbergia lenta]|uniref:Putative integral inner membrane protein n=1 Tax=Lederbergia lenta TaxID=1467 RepID=A0A2X4WDT4_LEDLE|nr:DUF418 domain-containing protein [Lederbergia lenta]MEC2323959.1 DUF418 domain-containing protein [Lederbergia lenta]SQI60899.1 putative integral inner membrane protein [Lederbergia lenta]